MFSSLERTSSLYQRDRSISPKGGKGKSVLEMQPCQEVIYSSRCWKNFNHIKMYFPIKGSRALENSSLATFRTTEGHNFDVSSICQSSVSSGFLSLKI